MLPVPLAGERSSSTVSLRRAQNKAILGENPGGRKCRPQGHLCTADAPSSFTWPGPKPEPAQSPPAAWRPQGRAQAWRGPQEGTRAEEPPRRPSRHTFPKSWIQRKDWLSPGVRAGGAATGATGGALGGWGCPLSSVCWAHRTTAVQIRRRVTRVRACEGGRGPGELGRPGPRRRPCC